jgi:Uma2 family endonuclease
MKLKLMIDNPHQIKRIIRRRRLMGGDRYDEVWDGVYVLAPLADNVHQEIAGSLTAALKEAAAIPGGRFFPGVNVSDRADDWRQNFRCPDVAVYLPGNPAEDRESHWLGGPDFAVEVISPYDRSRKKFEFYAKVGVRELLLVSRKPWRLELYRQDAGTWTKVGVADVSSANSIRSDVLNADLRLIHGGLRPQIEIARPSDGQTWLV